MKKRDVFAEIVEGFDTLKAQREGKVTLRTHAVVMQAPADVTADEVLALRQRSSRAMLLTMICSAAAIGNGMIEA